MAGIASRRVDRQGELGAVVGLLITLEDGCYLRGADISAICTVKLEASEAIEVKRLATERLAGYAGVLYLKHGA